LQHTTGGGFGVVKRFERGFCGRSLPSGGILVQRLGEDGGVDVSERLEIVDANDLDPPGTR
jgi:hypothetical protein